ncbi:MAG: LAGLIDADG family homing endonuclease [Candidatus Hadarchaeota archaeon]
MKMKWSEEEIETLKKGYSKMGSPYLTTVLNRTQCAINVKAKRLGLKGFSGHCRRYSMDENYFELIDHPRRAYLLGLLMADGYVFGNKTASYGVELGLKISDRELVNMLKTELKAEHPIRIRPRGNTADIRLIVFSKKLAESLVGWGVKQRKSLRERYPPILDDEELHRFFILGYSDGDGSISIDQQGKYRYLKWQLVGNGRFTQTVACIVQKFCGARGTVFKSKKVHGDFTELRFWGKEAEKALRWLYGNDTTKIGLKRKRKAG